MKKLALATICLLAFGGGLALAQLAPFKDPLLDRLAGHWVLCGIVHGDKTVHDLDAQWVLGHQYLLIHEVSREKSDKGQPIYLADVYLGWDKSTDGYVCIWLDVFGGISIESIGHAKFGSESMPFVFRDSNGKAVFHTTFSYDRSADAWVMDMDNEAAGKRTPFARTRLTKE